MRAISPTDAVSVSRHRRGAKNKQRYERSSFRLDPSNQLQASLITGEEAATRPKRFRRPRQRKRCHLLNLPGELRNRIYEFAVVQESELTITAKGPGQPALLSTCRKIRREAGTLYYGKNVFSLKIERYNGAAFAPFARQAHKFDVYRQMQTIKFRFDLEPDWDNLVS